VRSEEAILARARILNLVEALSHGVSLELLRPELQRHGLGIHLSEREARWFSDEEAVEMEDPRSAMIALAWTLGLTRSLEGEDVEAIRDALDALTPSVALREESTIRAKLETLAPGSAELALRWSLER
jgi:hypothetical protein